MVSFALMLCSRNNSVFIVFGVALIVVANGCSAPWRTPFERSQRADPATRPQPHTTDLPPATIQPSVVAEHEPDMAGVLDKLQQVRELDPAAEQKLLDELRRTPAKSWPLVAEQFRSSLAYSQKLAAKSPPVPLTGTALDDLLLTQRQVSANPVTIGVSRTSAIEGKPSAPIGSLVDPRNADSDGVSSEALAKTTPYSTPGVLPRADVDAHTQPAPFVASEKAVPLTPPSEILEQVAIASKPRLDTAVLQTNLEVSPAKKSSDDGVNAARESADWQELVKRAADDLSKRVADEPATTAEIHQHASLRMLWLLTGDTEKSLEPIPRISPTEQDYWSRQLFSLATFLDHHSQPDDKRRAAASVTHLDEALASMREMGALSLRNLTFCKNVYGYGSLEPFSKDEFAPGQQVSLYVEVDNYHSESTEKGYCTLLGSTYELLDEKGGRIAGGEFPDVDDCCRSRRRDFHIQFGLALPERMDPGRYQLQLVVKDRKSDKMGHATAAFEIRRSRDALSLSGLNAETEVK